MRTSPMVTNSDYKIAVTATYQQSAHRWVRWRTYTLWYNSAWPGICIHAVFAQNVSEARKLAIAACKRHRQSKERPDAVH